MEQRSVKKVIQQKCSSDIVSAASTFDFVDERGQAPLVLVPKKRSVAVFFLIPANAQCIVQHDGVDKGVWQAGRHTANYRHRIAYVVNRQAITYDYKVVACPTRDNVMVKVDITFVFTIIDPCSFCYKLGVLHFDDLLHAVAEEAIRTLVRSIDHTAVYELRSSCSEPLQNILNQTFTQFGVRFSSTTVKNVGLPTLIAQSLENASKIDSQIEKHVKENEYAIKKINDAADLEIKQYSVKEEQKMNNLLAKKERINIEIAKKIEEQRRINEREIIKVEQIAETDNISAQASYRDEQTKAKTSADKMVQEATAKMKNSQRQIDQWKQEELLKIERDLLFAENEFKILKMQIEAKESENMKGLRDQEIRLKRTEALDKLAKNGKLVISGKSGKSLLEQFTF